MARPKGSSPAKIVLSVRVDPPVADEVEAVRQLVAAASPVPVRQADVISLALREGLGALRKRYGK